MKNWHLYLGLVIVIVIILVLVRGNGGGNGDTGPQKVTRFDDFAQCLTDAGAIFFGSYSCSHCQSQKEMFDKSDKIPYVECSTLGGGQVKECSEAGITAYPTWQFADGEQMQGVQSFETLADKTGCVLPE